MPEFGASVCVFCGARQGLNARYATDAREIGARFAQEGWRLVYGAGDSGIMGTVAQSVRDAGGAVLGVIPTHLLGDEQTGQLAENTIITQTMHERKKVMFMNSDAVLILPGGAGTLDEFFEVLTWAQLGLHHKPICILNSQGIWTPLLDLVQQLVDQGFADRSLSALFSVADRPEAAITALRAALSARNASQV